MNPLRAFVTLLLLVTLPLQGVAAYGTMTDCDGMDSTISTAVAPAPVPAMHSVHEPCTMSTAADTHSPCDSTLGHGCCHHGVSALASVVIPGIPANPQPVTPRVMRLTTLFIPEQPQHPPRA